MFVCSVDRLFHYLFACLFDNVFGLLVCPFVRLFVCLIVCVFVWLVVLSVWRLACLGACLCPGLWLNFG